MQKSAATGRPVAVESIQKTIRPSLKQEVEKPSVKQPELVRAAAPLR